MNTKLSVNINKVALLRNARGRDYPSVEDFAVRCLDFGAHGITLHPRPDQRHARYSDVDTMRRVTLSRGVELNIEGNPITEFMELVLRSKPDQCTLVPDAPDQVTSDHGWDLKKNGKTLAPILEQLRTAGIRSSLFIDADNLENISCAMDVGADRIELYTEAYAEAYATNEEAHVIEIYRSAAEHAASIGLAVNAGHDLNLDNLTRLFKHVPLIEEVSIGHALIIEALEFGLQKTLKSYLKILEQS